MPQSASSNAPFDSPSNSPTSSINNSSFLSSNNLNQDNCAENLIDLRDLLRQHKIKIAQLRDAVGEPLKVIKSCQQADNLFLLRFVLSYTGDTEKAAESVTKALEWRKKHHSFVKNAMLADHHKQLVNFPTRMQPYLKTIRSLLSAWGHKSTRNGQPVVLIRVNCCNFPLLVSLVPLDIIRDYVIFSNEVEFWWCDRITRRSGKIHKCFRLVDLKGMSSKSIDRRFLKVFGQTSKMSEFLHPQLVAKTILVNGPSFIRWVVDALKAVGVSRRALDKLWVHKQDGDKPIAQHADISEFISLDCIPDFLGGNCSCTNGCVPGSPNDRREPIELDVSRTEARIREKKRNLIAERHKVLQEKQQQILRQMSAEMQQVKGNVGDEVSRPEGLPPRQDRDEDYDISSGEDDEARRKKEANNGDEFFDAKEEEAVHTLIEKMHEAEI